MNDRLAHLSEHDRALLLRRVIEKNRARAEESLRSEPTAHLTVDRRALLTLFASGQLQPVDAISIGSLSDLLLRNGNGRDQRQITDELCHDLPVFSSVRTLPQGRIASLTVPRFYSQIYADRSDIVRLVDQCLHMGRLIGAKAASLTGLIASATDYGRALPARTDLPLITTGHATTASAVVLTIRDLLERTARPLTGETVAFMGLGSVGCSVLRLMLHVLPHPKRIVLCDVYQKCEAIETLMTTIRREDGYRGSVAFQDSGAAAPEALYRSSFIVGATNVPDVIDTTRLRPGTLIVDDSDPHCFDSQRAIARLEEQADILFTEGGALRSPMPISQLLFIPAELANVIPVDTTQEAATRITGCVLSSLLSATQGYPAIRGLVAIEDALVHYHGLIASGFSAPQPHFGGFIIPQSIIGDFRRLHGRPEAV